MRLDTFQKIFPLPKKPLVIAHHGENIFLDETGKEIPLQAFLVAFFRDNADVFEQVSIESITGKIAEKIEPIVRHTLRNRGEELIGFWVAGFARGRVKPEIYEIVWFKNGNVDLHPCHNLVVGGEGQEHLPPSVRDYLDGSYNVNIIPKASVEKVRRYHDKLFPIALRKEQEPRRFSQEIDQLAIMRDCWRWIIKPINLG